MPNVSDRAHAGKLQSVIPCGVLSGFPPTTDLQSGQLHWEGWEAVVILR